MPELPDKPNEKADVTGRRALVMAAVILAVVVAGTIAAWATIGTLDAVRGTDGPRGRHRGVPLETWPEPRLQAAPPEDLRRLELWAQERLSGWEWVDRAGGVARIPVDRAAALVLERGLPARPGGRAPEPWSPLLGEASGGLGPGPSTATRAPEPPRSAP